MKHLKPYKLFEATYYEDDLNVDITSTISDIFEDLTDDSDFDVTCFTVGYTTLKQAGTTFTDNDIHFSIMKSHYSHDDNELTYKSFTINQILPYLKRTIDFIELEGRFASKIHIQYRGNYEKIKQINIETIDELFDYDDFEIESLGMTFVLNSKKKVNEGEYSGIFGNKNILNLIQDIKYALIDLKDDGWYTNISYRPKRWESAANPIKSDSIGIVIKKKENKARSQYPGKGSMFNIQDIREYIERIGNMFSDNEINSRKCKPDGPPDIRQNGELFGLWGDFSSNYNEQILNSKDNVLGVEMIISLDGENIDQNETTMNESLLEIKEDAEYIQDIFSGIIDDGVRVFFARAGLPNRYTIRIGEYSDQVKFKYSDISNEIEHLKSYLINDRNMRLSDVEVDFVGCFSSDVYGYGRRLEGWERLNVLKEKDMEMYSMAISFKTDK